MPSVVITSKEEMEAIIAKCDVCYVGLADTDGTPYVLPMNFGYKDGIIYLHSGQEGRKTDILKRNNRVCITFSTDHALSFQDAQMACSYTMKSKSVIVQGTVSFEEDFDKKIEILNIFMKNYSDREFKYSTPAINNVKVWKVEVNNMTGKAFGFRSR
ncbi:MAG: pyridoxamine 5'-phosphate oxidase family protein [Dysgonamonadaceae bacterium]|jgi:nitroimidazol reductase NimA-like FMN-containing flavoprotein (pyridoxamine 5'-phosphate oxidase superfamily)|nr:pyridoxamine 5'-phosphate oxidase family protein [Dysgonamonadaceae bacterium]